MYLSNELICQLWLITLSDTEVENPFSWVEAATAAVPSPTAVSIQLVSAKDDKKSIMDGIKSCRIMICGLSK